MNAYHPDLRLARFIPPLSFGPRSTRLMNRIPFPTSPAPSDLVIENLTVPGPDGAPDVPVRIYRRRAVTGDTPAMM